ncbi:beta-N-acetylhexosaminidase [Sunxiuqinia sp. sy24]|uniref:beta-N-acetylhexosaminidase n=1 Tax=Sunxiuqinia sp. sy24 TaxID=3461495 RepID=UPI004046753A
MKLLTVLLTLCLISNITQAQTLNIIPRPQEIHIQDGRFAINPQTEIIASVENYESAKVLQQHLQEAFGFENHIGEAGKLKANYIQFKPSKDLAQEAYALNISAKSIEISASSQAGWFYGVQSLLQLMDNQSKDIPAVSISDSPRFAWRAFMLDEARYFKGAEQVKLLLNEMARLKMNVFHWHLVDDQGWRIEIKKYPLLTQVGSKRSSTQVGPLKWNSPIQSAEVHEGFYTQEQIKEIIAYAQARHITIVPEIEMPGHSSAAIAAYPWLGTAKKEIEVPIKFGVGTDVYDVSDPKVYQFLTDVLDEVMELFPSQVIHIGGDEVKYDHWKSSETVQAYMKENGISSPAGLQVFFTNRISNYLESKGKRMMGWNEIMGHNLHHFQDESDTKVDQQLAQQTLIHFWKGDFNLATTAASSGYEIVNSLHSQTYLDYDYQSIPLSKAYHFDPIPKGLAEEYHSKVIGTGSQMWGEWIPTNGHMHFMVFPRLAAYAEVGWTELENKDFDSFKTALKRLQAIWKQKGIYYAPDDFVEKK